MSWKAIRCVGFDFDGTLVESNPIKRAGYFDALAGVPGAPAVIEEVLVENPRADRHGILARVHERLAASGTIGLPALSESVAAYSSICEARVIACEALPGAIEGLQQLRATHALYLASATPEDALVRVVAGRGWTGFFQGAYGGPRSKVENLERIAKREGLSCEEIAYIGDGAVDREAADRFGCPFYGYGSAPDDLREGPLVPLVREIARRAAALSAG